MEMNDIDRIHNSEAGNPRRWAFIGGLIFGLLGILLGFYFGGYPGFLFFKQFHWFPLAMTPRTYLGLAFGFILGIFIFWAFGTIGGAFLWWLFRGRRRNA